MELCKLNADVVYPMVLRITSDLLLAREITIEVFISAWENLIHHRSDIPFSDWLKGIAIYMSLEEIRTHKRKKQIQKLQKTIPNKINVKSPSSKNKLENMVFALPEMQRVIFVLHDMEGYSCQEISDFIGESSYKKIKNELKKTRRELITGMQS